MVPKESMISPSRQMPIAWFFLGNRSGAKGLYFEISRVAEPRESAR